MKTSGEVLKPNSGPKIPTSFSLSKYKNICLVYALISLKQHENNIIAPQMENFLNLIVHFAQINIIAGS